MSSTPSDPEPSKDAPIDPPRHLGGILRRIGPGIIITGSIVGSGELIVTTKLGAEVGFTFLWLIILSCAIKVFLQIEIGRYVISSGNTALEGFDGLPGPRLGANWLIWCWAVMAVFSVFQLAGILFGIASIFTITFAGTAIWVWALPVALLTALLLSTGRYKHIERTTTLMVFTFTVITIAAGFFLQGTEQFSIELADLKEGLSFKIPRDKLLTAFAAFGITGVGATELIYYPYWCIEKGYAKFTGPREDSDAWLARAHGWIHVMKVDAWISMVIYTVGTVAFYFLGATVLNRQDLVPQDAQMIETLSEMYTKAFAGTFGENAGMWVFLIGAFAVLFSTFFVATASNTRLFSDSFQVFRLVRYKTSGQRLLAVRILCVFLPLFCLGVILIFEKPVTLILAGAIAQASFLPLIAIAAIYLRYRKTDARVARRFWFTEIALWLAALTLIAIGIFQLYERILKALGE